MEYSEAVDALEQAIAVFKKQSRGRRRASLLRLKKLKLIPIDAKHVIDAFLQKDPVEGLAVSAPEANVCESQGGFVEMLQKLLDKFAEQKCQFVLEVDSPLPRHIVSCVETVGAVKLTMLMAAKQEQQHVELQQQQLQQQQQQRKTTRIKRMILLKEEKLKRLRSKLVEMRQPVARRMPDDAWQRHLRLRRRLTVQVKKMESEQMAKRQKHQLWLAELGEIKDARRLQDCFLASNKAGKAFHAVAQRPPQFLFRVRPVP